MTTSDSLTTRLTRRLPRVLVPYIGGMWGLVQFTDWACGHYMLSPYLVDVAITVAVLLLPTVLLLAYFRGEEGRTPWTRAEKLGIPVNLATAAAVLFVTFHARELGAVTRKVEVRSATGATVERQVPKSGFRKHVALFFIANRSGDAREDWVGHAFADLMAADLAQDLFVTVRKQYDFVDQIKKTGAPPGDALPLGLQQQLAREANLDFIVFGSFAKEGQDLVIELSLAPTSRGTPIAERRHRGPDLFKLVDAASLQLRRDLGIPAAQIENSTDLPVAEISTHSLLALRAQTQGLGAWKIDNDARAALPLLEQAVKIDPTYAQSWFTQAMLLFLDNRETQMAAAMAAVKKNEYRLSEPQRFDFESIYTLLKRDPDAELAVLRQWESLYPDDVTAHLHLVSTYLRRNRLDEAKAEMAQVLELDPGNARDLLEMGGVFEARGDNESAVQQYRRYQDKVPTDPRGYLRAADLYVKMARNDDAMKSYDKALAVAPDAIEAVVGMSAVQMRLGQLDRAQETLDRALKQSPGQTDTVALLEQETTLLGVQGKWQRAVETLHKSWSIAKQAESAMMFGERQLWQTHVLVQAGRAQEALEVVRQAERASDNVNITLAAAMAVAEAAAELHDVARARAAIEKLDGLMKVYDVAQMRWVVWELQARVAEAEGAWETAIAKYRAALDKDTSADTLVRLAHCERMARQYKAAHATLAKALERFPALPEAHDELARLYVDEGERGKAAGEVAAALKVWAEADAGWARAVEAQKLSAELRAHP